MRIEQMSPGHGSSLHDRQQRCKNDRKRPPETVWTGM
jgi:hypothetical protein